MAATLDGIEIGDHVIWSDQWDWTPVKQEVRKTLDGTLVIESISPPADGRPITLHCGWLGLDIIESLEALRDRTNQAIMTLILADARTFSVIFRHQDGAPVNVVAVTPLPDYDDTDFFDATLKLMEVSGA